MSLNSLRRNVPHALVRPWTWLLGLALVFALAWAVFGVLTVRFPFGIDYGEGLVWQQALLILTPAAYGPIDRFPLVVFQYPPLYHGTIAAIVQLTGVDPLVLGRSIALAATLGCCLLVRAVIVRLGRMDEPRARLAVLATLAALLALTMRPVYLWSALMRVDMVTALLSLTGFLLALHALHRPRMIHVAAVAFVAAMFTKQTAISAPAGVFAVLLVLRPRLALSGIATALALGLAGLAALEWQTGGGFLRHIVFYNINRLLLANLEGILEHWLFNAVWLALGLYGVRARIGAMRAAAAQAGGGLRGWRQLGGADTGYLMLVAWLGFGSVLTFSYLKAGSAINYFVEWSFVSIILAGLGLCEIARRLEAGAGTRALRGLAWLPVLQVAISAPFLGEGYLDKVRSADMTARMVEQVRLADKPVIADDMVALLRGGKTMQWEPFIFTELTHIGLVDRGPALERIAAGHYAFFITEGAPGNGTYETRFDPQIDAAMRRAYPDEVQVGRFFMHFPAGQVPQTLREQ